VTPGQGVVVIVVLPMAVQFASYFGLARLAFGVPRATAVRIAGVRVVVGLVLFWACFLLAGTVGTGLAFSSPIAWTVAAFMDPRRSIRRGIAWVVVGTALTFAINEAYWRVAGLDVMSMSTRFPFG
jgi:hypothetical protein